MKKEIHQYKTEDGIQLKFVITKLANMFEMEKYMKMDDGDWRFVHLTCDQSPVYLRKKMAREAYAIHAVECSNDGEEVRRLKLVG